MCSENICISAMTCFIWFRSQVEETIKLSKMFHQFLNIDGIRLSYESCHPTVNIADNLGSFHLLELFGSFCYLSRSIEQDIWYGKKFGNFLNIAKEFWSSKIVNRFHSSCVSSQPRYCVEGYFLLLAILDSEFLLSCSFACCCFSWKVLLQQVHTLVVYEMVARVTVLCNIPDVST